MTTQILFNGSSKTDFRAGRTARLTALLCVTLLIAGCGGGGSPSPPAQTISVTVSPSTATLQVGKTQQFTATVSGTTNTAVTWSVNNVAGDNSTVGTISTSGLYTAPNAVPSTNPVTVTATSQADATKSASSSVTIAQQTTVSQVTVTAGQTTSANISLTSMTPTLQFLAIGTCPPTGNCTAGSTGVQLTQGSSATLFVVGNGFVAGTVFTVSGPPSSDVTLGSPTFAQTDPTNPPVFPAATMSVTVSANATPGPRNVMATNGSAELTVFAGGLLICPLTGCP